MRYPARPLNRLRPLIALLSLLAAAALIAACGGGSDSSSESPQKVLDQTFSGNNEKVNSGKIDLSLKVDVKGDQSATLDASVSGPFENEGANKVPKLDLDVSANGSGDGAFSFDGGLTSTGDAAFVNYKGTDYEVDQRLFDQFKQQIEQAAGQQTQNQGSAKALLKSLGIEDPKQLLTNLSNEGTTDVEGTDTTHISGDVDVNRLVDGIKNLASTAGALGALGGSSSSIPSGDQLDQIKEAVKTAHFDLYSGNDDHILRRLTLDLKIEPPSGSTSSVDVNFDVTLSGVNESQTIEAPSNPKPFSELLSALGVPASALDQLGSLGGLGAGSGSSSGDGSSLVTPGGSGSGSSTDTGQAKKYLQCLSQATSAADLQKCQSLQP